METRNNESSSPIPKEIPDAFSDSSKATSGSITASFPHIQPDMSALFNKEHLHDLVIELSDGEKIFAHQIILSMHSKVLYTNFLANPSMRDSTSKRMEISDADPESTRRFIRCLYSLKDTHTFFTDVQSILPVYLLAHRYDATTIQAHCISQLILQITNLEDATENSQTFDIDSAAVAKLMAAIRDILDNWNSAFVNVVLQKTSQYDFDQNTLYELIMNVVCTKLPRWMVSERNEIKAAVACNMSDEALKIILSEDSVSINEKYLVLLVIQWCMYKSGCERPTDPKDATVFDESMLYLFRLIRWGTLTLEDLSELYNTIRTDAVTSYLSNTILDKLKHIMLETTFCLQCEQWISHYDYPFVRMKTKRGKSHKEKTKAETSTSKKRKTSVATTSSTTTTGSGTNSRDRTTVTTLS